ncbi:MAG: YdcF family protein [Rhodospirillales bacterium CG15_BIG_FIL_POST_REV_8_21_14_020_66_15]|nr:MAG: YdcF family protein [Rhodospirillales bacterium CG15_BIG_FIL_POST_REV_8_21_14_020_66_15]
MYFILSKTLWFLAKPSMLMFLGMTLGFVMVLTTRLRRWGLALFGVTILALWAVTVVPLGEMMIRDLEERFPQQTALPETIGGIIVLGGSIDPLLTRARGQIAVDGSVERLLFFAMLGDARPGVPLVFTGGSGHLFDQEAKEGHYFEDLAKLLGIDMSRVIVETQSRNTMENAARSKALVTLDPARPWVLITSARHMPRAVGVFRNEGWPVIPYPVDYVTLPARGWTLTFENLGGQVLLDSAVHEFIGMAVAYVMGRSDSLYPAP